MAEHSTLSGSSLHEPKGIDSAGTSDAGKVLTPSSSTAGVGSLRFLAESEVTGKTEYIVTTFVDVSTAGSIYIPMNFGGTVTAVRSVLHGAIVTSDVTLTCGVGGVNMTNGVITIAFSGSAAGDVDLANPTAGNTFVAGNYLNVTSNGASTNAVNATLMFTVTRT